MSVSASESRRRCQSSGSTAISCGALPEKGTLIAITGRPAARMVATFALVLVACNTVTAAPPGTPTTAPAPTATPQPAATAATAAARPSAAPTVVAVGAGLKTYSNDAYGFRLALPARGTVV